MLNVVIIEGRLSHDPEITQTSVKGVCYCKLRFATERDYVTDGKRKTDFLSAVAWRETAQFVAQNFRKGDAITIRGRLEEDVWRDQEGQQRSRMVINVDQVYFGETKQAREDRQRRSNCDKNCGCSNNQESDDSDAEQLPF